MTAMTRPSHFLRRLLSLAGVLAAMAPAAAATPAMLPDEIAWRVPDGMLATPAATGLRAMLQAPAATHTLAPGATRRFELPARRLLRWQAANGDMPLPTVMVADDGGLFRTMGGNTTSGFHWLPPTARARQVLIENSGAQAITVRVWIGEPFAPATLPVRMTARPDAPARDGAPRRYTLTGPLRVEIESFQLLDQPTARPAWNLSTQIDDGRIQPWNLFAPVDTRPARRDASPHASAARSVVLDIPAGKHALSVQPDPDVSVRVFAGAPLLFDGNEQRLYPRAAEARTREQHAQEAREALVVGDPAPADARWRELDPDAALLQARTRAWIDLEPATTDSPHFQWQAITRGNPLTDLAATDTEADVLLPARLLRSEPGKSLHFSLAAAGALEITAAGDHGTRIHIQRGDTVETLVLRGDTPTVSGRVLLEESRGSDTLVITTDRVALVRLRGAQARNPLVLPPPARPAVIDMAQLLREPRRAPGWLLPLAERLALRLPASDTGTGAAPCTSNGTAPPADWATQVDRLVDANDPERAVALLVEVRRHCAERARAGDRLATLLRTAGEWHAWLAARLDDARSTQENHERATRELRAAFRRDGDWTALESLAAARLAAGDATALNLAGEALVQQGESALVTALCPVQASAGVQADTPLLAHACREAAAGRPASPWRPLVAVDGDAAALRSLENTATGQRTTRYLATSDQPLQLRLDGAQRLRLEVRRLAGEQGDVLPPGWLAVELDGVTRGVPLAASVPSADWHLVAGDAAVGQAQRYTVSMPAGAHVLRVHGGDPVLVSVSAADPAWASVLSRTDTGTHADNGTFLEEISLGDTDISMPPDAHLPADTSHRGLLRLAWWAEHAGGTDQRAWQARLLAALHAQPVSAWHARLRARGEWRRTWQRESRIVDSAGLRYVEGIAPASPSLRLRRALLGLPADDAFAQHGAWLTPDNAPGVLVDGRAWQQLRVVARQAAAPAASGVAPTAIVASIDDQPVAQLALAPGSPQETTFTVPAGMHRVVLRLVDGTVDPATEVMVEGISGNRREMLSLQADRAFLVSRADAPVRIAVDSAEWLRIDEITQGGLQTTYHLQPDAGTVTLAPGPGGERVLRVYALRQDATVRPAAMPATPQPRPSLARSRALTILGALDTPASWQLDPAVAATLPATLHDDTVYFVTERRTDVDAGTRDAGVTHSLGFQHRQRLAAPRTWWRSDTFLRAPDGPEHSVGTVQTLEWRPEDRAWYAQFEGLGYVELAAGDTDEYAGVLVARWRLEHDISRATSHRFGAELFVRGMTADPVRGATIKDQDVWSSWKNDHRHGLRLRDRWRWQPVADALLQLEYGLDGNEAGDRPLDSAWLAPSVHGWWRGVSLDASYRRQEYREDGKRDAGYRREWLDLGATWNIHGARNGWYIETRWRRELRLAEDSLSIGAGWRWGAGPRAWLPSELPFRTLESRAHDAAGIRDRLSTDNDHAGR